MLHEYTPLIQQYSIDEAWMDMTGIQEAQADPMGFATGLRTGFIGNLDLR